MALKSSLLFILISTSTFAKSFPELIAKQSNENIRFISSDGKYTYYQRRSGSFHLSRNYKSIDIFKGAKGTQYTVYSTSSRKKIIVTQDETFHSNLSLRKKEKIYILNMGDSIPREIGEGSNPRLLLEDNWISYYSYFENQLNFENTANGALKFAIKLNNKINPYFIPDVVMSDENTIYYTDLGENGNYGIVKYKRNLEKTDIIIKEKTSNIKYNLLICGEALLFIESGIGQSNFGTKISILPKLEEDIKKVREIYRSDLNDLGNYTCDFSHKSIYFTKNYGDKNFPIYDIAELDLSTKQLNKLTELRSLTSLYLMDGILLSFEKGKNIIIKGEADYKNVDLLKSLPKEKTEEPAE